ncbi:MAG: carboxypeptidase-like regulatory domain-containing protein [Bacteroidia bacterium]|nr:carboxypeptidase-like regulatory domain-containing protein [Bacteroidia bacterium]
MRKYILYLLFSPQLVFAQTTLTGTVKDEKRNPIPYANVFLKPDNSQAIVAYGQSDEKGSYKLRTNRTGKLWLNFSALSYKTAILPIELTSGTIEITKNATMVYEPIELNEVIVSADKSMIVKKDTIIFNAKSFAKGNERVVEDLLKKIPGLNVADDGTIKVGNKDIEKIMVDGDDFFEKGYRILSKNMPAYPIEKVEVYQHYSNNKLLKGIESSDKVALNLKLDEKSKRQWFGNLATGFGPGEVIRYEGFSNLMNFGKKNKFYGIASLNNIGEDSSGDINFLIRPSEQDEPGSAGDNQSAHTVLDISTFSPNLKQERILFNNSGIYSLNGIFTLSSKVKVKVLAFLNTDENNYFNSSFESTSVGEISFTNTEDHHLRKTKMTGFGKIDLTKDISKTQTLFFTSKYNRSDENGQNKLVFNDSVTNEKLENTNLLVAQRFVYTNKFKKNKVLLLTGSYIYENSPQHYSLDKFFYQDLFPAATGVNEVSQNSKNQMQFAGLEAHLMDKKTNGNLLEAKLGNQYRSDNLSSNFYLIADKNSMSEPSGYQNNLVYTTGDLYLTTKFRLGLKKFGLISVLDFHQLYNQIERPGNTLHQYPFFINPLVGMEWSINEKNKFLTTYSYNHTNATVLDVYDQYINAGFRSFTKGTGNFNQLNQTSVVLNYTYGGWGEKSFANAFLMYNKNYDFYSTNTIVSRNYAQSEKILIKDREFIILSSNIDRYIKTISSTLKLNFGFTMSNYKNMVNSSDLRNIKSNNFNYGFELRSGLSGLFNYHIGSKWNYHEVITNTRNKYTDNLSFLDLSFVFSKKVEVQLQTERYFFGSLDKNNNKYYFLDVNTRYTIKENKFTITLSGKNLLNTETFRSYSITDISVSKSEYRLLPRYLLLKAEYRF